MKRTSTFEVEMYVGNSGEGLHMNWRLCVRLYVPILNLLARLLDNKAVSPHLFLTSFGLTFQTCVKPEMGCRCRVEVGPPANAHNSIKEGV